MSSACNRSMRCLVVDANEDTTANASSPKKLDRRAMMNRQASCSAALGNDRRAMMNRQSSCFALGAKRSKNDDSVETTESNSNNTKPDRKNMMLKQMSLSTGLSSASSLSTGAIKSKRERRGEILAKQKSLSSGLSSSISNPSGTGTGIKKANSAGPPITRRPGMRDYLHKQRSFSGATMGRIDKTGKFVPSKLRP